MEYESKYERVKKDSKEGSGERLAPEKRDAIVWMTKEGHTQKEIEEAVNVSSHTVVNVRNDMGDKDINIGNYKKDTADLFKKIVMKGAKRLDEELHNIPIGSMPISLAILIDKIASLQDQPSVIVETRLKISHNDINKYLEGEIVDLIPEKTENRNSES